MVMGNGIQVQTLFCCRCYLVLNGTLVKGRLAALSFRIVRVSLISPLSWEADLIDNCYPFLTSALVANTLYTHTHMHKHMHTVEFQIEV